MCGLLFVEQTSSGLVSLQKFKESLARQSWRGPDAQDIWFSDTGRFLLGHNRLSIIDPLTRSDQPMISSNGRYLIIFNGEIYNHKKIREQLSIDFRTNSDTETVLEGYALLGEQIFHLMDGMFALVILDLKNSSWVAARDAFGIKPLFIGHSKEGEGIAIGSEAAVIANLLGSSPSQESIDEWRLIRRPVPGFSFFDGVEEVLPGKIIRQDGSAADLWRWSASSESYSQEKFEEILRQSITDHELSDVKNVSLLSGGLDSAVITALSSVSRSYCIGLPENNEFSGAEETASKINKELINIRITPQQMRENWRELTRKRGEPLSLPNEGLIYAVCKEMEADEKVVLTGEGADELLFGYDNIYRWSVSSPWAGVNVFLGRYAYSDATKPTDRLVQYIEMLRANNSTSEFVEDFFFRVHLPGLLRRMDFSSMAASKEARVPFVNKRLIGYMYRRNHAIKINDFESKIPIRNLAAKLGLSGALSRKKIGFSAQVDKVNSRFKEYEEFQQLIMEELQW
jgi:asparagine synthase (glutamine-hydrolysing)